MYFNTQSELTERGISLNVAAIEVGFGDTKWAYRDANNTIVRKSFPSLAPKHIKDALSSSMGILFALGLIGYALIIENERAKKKNPPT